MVRRPSVSTRTDTPFPFTTPSRSPLSLRLDPGRWPLVVFHAVQVMVEVAIALRQSEAARVLVAEAGDRDPVRVVQRPPDPLAGPGPHRQAGGIMHPRPPVDHGLLGIVGDPVHRGQRREPGRPDGPARVPTELERAV